jgi:predicted small lipoprotein YifL
MERSRGTKKALKAVLTLMALAAALATTGCAGGTLLGPDKGTEAQGQVTPQQGGQHINMGGQRVTP